MKKTLSHTFLAYFLALQDFPGTLSDQEKKSLKEVARDLNIKPEAKESKIEPSLVQIIQGNSQLYQYYQLYKEKLDQLGEIPVDLLPKAEEIDQLITNQSYVVRGNPPGPPRSYEQQLNNVVIFVNQADKPKEVVQQLGFFDKLKRFLSQDT